MSIAALRKMFCKSPVQKGHFVNIWMGHLVSQRNKGRLPLIKAYTEFFKQQGGRLVSYRKYLSLSIVIVVTGCGAHSDDPRQAFAKSVVDTLAADNWQRSAIKSLLCADGPRDSVDNGISFDLYQGYDGIKAIGKIKLMPMASPPAMAMDTFIPVLFNKQFAPFPAMPDHIAYHATYIQLQTQKTADGKSCLEGWGRNDIPVNSEQTQDFLNYKGIFNHD
jgi:hypothetical protein